MENNPSASVNTVDGLFHCQVCGTGHNTVSFIQAILECDIVFAKKVDRAFQSAEYLDDWTTCVTDEGTELLQTFGISPEVQEQLHISADDTRILYPISMYGHIVDIREYCPGRKPKVKSRTGSSTGYMYPFDSWNATPKNKLTLICAGEKDMAVARAQGFNAITLTGGEGTKIQMLAPFRGRDVAIVYDNDVPGIIGANNLALQLHGVANSVRVVNGFHSVCAEIGEDIADFFIKYDGTREQLIEFIQHTPEYVPTVMEKEKEYPIMSLLEASSKHINKLVRSNIQVTATSDATFMTPTRAYAEKFKLAGENDRMCIGDIKEWKLAEDNIQDLLHLMDNNFKEEAIKDNLKTILKIPYKEKYIKVNTAAIGPVYKSYVTDFFETTAKDVVPMEFVAYGVGVKLESGKKYLATYKLVPHPYKGQQLTMLVTDIVQANDSISAFEITPEVISHLKQVQDIPGTAAEKINTLVEKAKGLIGYDGNNRLIETLELTYHTVLQFNFGAYENIRGYLDTIVCGESRMGKSSTANALRETYALGTFTSLAGNSATIPGLIGGSNKVNGSYQTRAGVIPQNNLGLIIFEEFGKSKNNIITELTDIRSSNEVRIARVSGTITMPAMVRMLTLTNVKSEQGQIRPIASYPNGISILTELIGTAEDIARYDIMLILSDKGANQIDPLWEPEQPLETEVYRTKLRWVWSRKANQILLDREVETYIVEQANRLNALYNCHIKIFGTEAWKKIARLAIAVAGYLCSANDTYDKIVVTKEHVEYAAEFFISIYDNPTFKLREYVLFERQFSEIDEAGIALLQDLYNKNASLISYIAQSAGVPKSVLNAVTGTTNDELNKMLNQMAKGLFITFSKTDVCPTERFRKGLAQIQRNTVINRVGEGDDVPF